jgi:hypothetical protein
MVHTSSGMRLFACAVISMMTMHGEMVCVAPAIIADAATTAYTPGSKGLSNQPSVSSP